MSDEHAREWVGGALLRASEGGAVPEGVLALLREQFEGEWCDKPATPRALSQLADALLEAMADGAGGGASAGETGDAASEGGS
jgi:hypothetical protein